MKLTKEESVEAGEREIGVRSYDIMVGLYFNVILYSLTRDFFHVIMYILNKRLYPHRDKRKLMTRLDQLEQEAHANEEVIEADDLSDLAVAPRHHQIARLTALGFSSGHICGVMAMTIPALNAVRCSPLFKSVVKSLQIGQDEKVMKAREVLIDSAPKAAEVKVGLLESESEKIRGDTSSDILKGLGVTREDERDRGVTVNIAGEKMDLIFNTIMEIRGK